jgi:hypothetical protein
MVESLGQGPQPEFTVPSQVSGLEYLVEQIGPETIAKAVMAPEGSSVAEIRACIRRIEGGTMVDFLDQAGSSYDLFDRLGRDRLTDVLGIPNSTSDEELRAAIRELSRRSSVTELGLDPNASLTEISEEKGRRELAADIEKLGLEPDATRNDVYNAQLRAAVGLPPNASDEELKLAQDIGLAQEWANTTHKPIELNPERGPNESWDDWHKRSTYPR